MLSVFETLNPQAAAELKIEELIASGTRENYIAATKISDAELTDYQVDTIWNSLDRGDRNKVARESTSDKMLKKIIFNEAQTYAKYAIKNKISSGIPFTPEEMRKAIEVTSGFHGFNTRELSNVTQAFKEFPYEELTKFTDVEDQRVQSVVCSVMTATEWRRPDLDDLPFSRQLNIFQNASIRKADYPLLKKKHLVMYAMVNTTCVHQDLFEMFDSVEELVTLVQEVRDQAQKEKDAAGKEYDYSIARAASDDVIYASADVKVRTFAEKELLSRYFRVSHVELADDITVPEFVQYLRDYTAEHSPRQSRWGGIKNYLYQLDAEVVYATQEWLVREQPEDYLDILVAMDNLVNPSGFKKNLSRETDVLELILATPGAVRMVITAYSELSLGTGVDDWRSTFGMGENRGAPQPHMFGYGIHPIITGLPYFRSHKSDCPEWLTPGVFRRVCAELEEHPRARFQVAGNCIILSADSDLMAELLSIADVVLSEDECFGIGDALLNNWTLFVGAYPNIAKSHTLNAWILGALEKGDKLTMSVNTRRAGFRTWNRVSRLENVSDIQERKNWLKAVAKQLKGKSFSHPDVAAVANLCDGKEGLFEEIMGFTADRDFIQFASNIADDIPISDVLDLYELNRM